MKLKVSSINLCVVVYTLVTLYQGPSATCHCVSAWNLLKDDVDNHIQL